MYAKFRYGKFWLRSMASVGHILCGKGILVDPRKIEVVKNSHRPLFASDIQSFLGLDGYYKIFVEGFHYCLATNDIDSQEG